MTTSLHKLAESTQEQLEKASAISEDWRRGRGMPDMPVAEKMPERDPRSASELSKIQMEELVYALSRCMEYNPTLYLAAAFRIIDMHFELLKTKELLEHYRKEAE